MRVRFVDELNTHGEFDMNRVVPGDQVRFDGEYWQFTDDSADTPYLVVESGTLGDVVDSGHGTLLVKTHGERMRENGRTTGDFELAVTPSDVMLLVDSRDPRISGYRISAGLDVGLWEVVRSGVPAVSTGGFIAKAKAVAALTAWGRQLIHGESDAGTQTAAKVYAAIDALGNMSDDEWAAALSDYVS